MCQAGSIACLRCGTPLVEAVTAIPPGQDGPGELPTTTAWPTATQPGSRRRSAGPISLVAIAFLGLAIVAGINVLSDGELPEEIQGIPRLRTIAAQEFEERMSAFSANGVRVRSALYGNGSSIELVLSVVESDLPISGSSPGDFLRRPDPDEMALGSLQAEATFSIDRGNVQELDEGNIRAACAPIDGLPDPYADADGILCVWSSEGRTGALLWSTTEPPGQALIAAGLRAVVAADDAAF